MKAEAWPTSGNVQVTVRAKCNGGGTYRLSLYSPSIGTRTFSGTYSGAYKTAIINLTGVPRGSGTYVNYNLYCYNSVLGGKTSRGQWGIARPAFGGNVNKVVCAYALARPCYF